MSRWDWDSIIEGDLLFHKSQSMRIPFTLAITITDDGHGRYRESIKFPYVKAKSCIVIWEEVNRTIHHFTDITLAEELKTTHTSVQF